MTPSSAPFIAAAAAAKKRREIFEAFRRSSAVSPEKGKTLDELGIADSHHIRVQIEREVIIPLADGKYFLDERRLTKADRLQYWGLFIGLCIVCTIVAVLQFIW